MTVQKAIDMWPVRGSFWVFSCYPPCEKVFCGRGDPSDMVYWCGAAELKPNSAHYDTPFHDAWYNKESWTLIVDAERYLLQVHDSLPLQLPDVIVRTILGFSMPRSFLQLDQYKNACFSRQIVSDWFSQSEDLICERTADRFLCLALDFCTARHFAMHRTSYIATRSECRY